MTIAGLVASGTEGRDAIRSAIADLEAHGYLVREQQHDEEGRFGEVDYRLADPWAAPLSDYPTSGEPTSGEPTSVDPHHKNNISSEHHLEETSPAGAASSPSFSEDVIQLTARFAAVVKGNGHKTPPSLSSWHPVMDKLLRIDGETPESVAYVIDWLATPTFWAVNCQSATSLRKNFTRLKGTIKLEREKLAKKPPSERPTTVRRITGYDDGTTE